MLAVGKPAPDFALKDGEGHMVRLSELRGRRVVLYFYPKDDTPGCTREACSFQEHLSRFRGLHTAVLGVSADDAASHRRFAAKYGLAFTLLSDPERAVCRAYGVYKPKTLYGRVFKGIERTTVLIDAQGRITHIFPKVKVDGHTSEILEALRQKPTADSPAAHPVKAS